MSNLRKIPIPKDLVPDDAMDYLYGACLVLLKGKTQGELKRKAKKLEKLIKLVFLDKLR